MQTQHHMEDREYQMLESLLRKFRDDSVDREEFDKRESLRFDVAFECQIRGINLLPNDQADPRRKENHE
jgi:hypothetical protein